MSRKQVLRNRPLPWRWWRSGRLDSSPTNSILLYRKEVEIGSSDPTE